MRTKISSPGAHTEEKKRNQYLQVMKLSYRKVSFVLVIDEGHIHQYTLYHNEEDLTPKSVVKKS